VIKAALILIGLLAIAAVIILWFVSLISWDGIIPEHPYWDPEYDEDEEGGCRNRCCGSPC